MVVGEASINNIMGGIESTGGVRLHNHRRKLKQRFDIIKKLGQGTYGKVQLGINKETGQEVAIKTIKKCKIETEADLIRIRREIQIMSSVQHPNIIHIYEVFENREKMVLVMEYAAGGELYDYLSERKVLVEEEARRIFRQISTAVYYCHKHKICHRDLKLENILLDENGNAKIADFGLSNVFDDQRLLSTFCGSPLYASPEIVKGTPYHGPEVDCWSLGVLLYTLVYGAMPFDGSNFKRLVKQISQGDYFEPKKPSPASPLIRDMLTVNPKKRADVEKICSHWWVNQDYEESCLDIAEDLANQTPVRLDLLLSLAPPPQSDKLLVAGEQIAEEPSTSSDASAPIPMRSQSVGSLMELSHPAERRIRELAVTEETSPTKTSPKRKLEVTVSTEKANQSNGDAKRIQPETESDVAVPLVADREEMESVVKSATQTLSRSKEAMEVEETPAAATAASHPETAPQVEGAACAEIVKEAEAAAAAAKKPETTASTGATDKKKVIKVKKIASPKKKVAEDGAAAAAAASAVPQTQETTTKDSAPTEPAAPPAATPVVQKQPSPAKDKENVSMAAKTPSAAAVTSPEAAAKTVEAVEAASPVKKEESAKPTVKRKVIKKKVLTEKQDNASPKATSPVKDATATATEAKADVQEKKAASPALVTKETAAVAPLAKEKKEAPPPAATVAPSPAATPTDASPSAKSSPQEENATSNGTAAAPPAKPIERRRSKIFETAEKFQNIISANEATKPVVEKPKKIIIPGVSVGGFKKEFERKASLTSTAPIKPSLTKKSVSVDQNAPEEKLSSPPPAAMSSPPTPVTSPPPAPVSSPPPAAVSEGGVEDERKKQLRNAVSIISNAIEGSKDAGTRKSKSRPSVFRKPPVPYGVGGRSASGSIPMIPSPMSPPSSVADVKRKLTLQIGEEPTPRTATVQVSTPEHTRFITPPSSKDQQQTVQEEEEPKSSSLEITLKSATLPRRKTHAEIQLDYPQPKAAQMEFKTEMAHQIGGEGVVPQTAPVVTQRSEVTFPVNAPSSRLKGFRSASLEPESTKTAPRPTPPRERIIPISFESDAANNKIPESPQSPPSSASSATNKPPAPRGFSAQRSLQSQKSNSFSRQSTLESDSETVSTSAPEPIKKSPREYIIPIAIEGGGYVTPRAGSLEPSESSTSAMTSGSRRTFGSRSRRLNSLLNDRDSEDESSPFGTLHRHSSFGRDSDNEDSSSRKDMFHMHRLRSTRPKHTLEHTDSLSSGEDDDEGFEILTAENLFSTLLSRVRSLTQRLNVDDDRPGFPSSRLFGHHFEPTSNFWNMHNRDPLNIRNSPLGRTFSRERSTSSSRSNLPGGPAPWRRSVSRDLASDIESVFKDSPTASATATLPRDKNANASKDLNLSDLDLKKLKLSDEDALALSYLTPGLSRRIQKQLLAQLPASQARKLQRKLSKQQSAPVGDDCGASTASAPSVIRENEILSASGVGDAGDSISQSLSAADTRNFDRYSPYNDRSTKSEGFDYSLSRRSRTGRSISTTDGGTSRRYGTLGRPLSYSRSPESSLSDLSSSRLGTSGLGGYSSTSDYTPDASCLSKYLTTGRASGYHKSQSVPDDTTGSAALKRASSSIGTAGSASRRISRFLRPDFFDVPREESVYEKEKKEREMETQKVLKEIRDKRIKNRLSSRRDRSASKEDPSPEANSEKDTTTIGNFVKDLLAETALKQQQQQKVQASTYNNDAAETKDILKNVSENIKNLETRVKSPEPDAAQPAVTAALQPSETIPAAAIANGVLKKENVSKIARPKSYPSENDSKVVPEKSKISKLKKGFVSKKTNQKESSPKPHEDEKHQEKQPEKEKKGNKFLHSIEKKFEKLKAFNSGSGNSSTTTEDQQQKCGSVGNTIKKLREQSLPRHTVADNLTTESGLIKRAVSVEDLSSMDAGKALQASRKSVTKILGLFKKYEDRDKAKVAKMKKAKDEANGEVQKREKSVPKNVNENGTNGTLVNGTEIVENGGEATTKIQRPKSLLLDKTKKNQESISSPAAADSKPKSKLPVTSQQRKSANLDNGTAPAPAIEPEPEKATTVAERRSNLHLDLSKVQHCKSPEPNSCTSPDNDDWSTCSADYHHNNHNDLSPLSPSFDDNESVIDRIRRKSFYSRFNEIKKPRKSGALELDLKYMDSLDLGNEGGGGSTSKHLHRPSEFAGGASSASSGKSSKKAYGRSSSLLEYGNKYQTYNPRLHKRSSVYPHEDFLDAKALSGFKDGASTDESKCFSFQNQSSKCSSGRTSISPSHLTDDPTSSSSQHNNSVPTTVVASSTPNTLNGSVN